MIIPTRDRPETAELLVRKVLTMLPADCSVAVQDASDEPTLGGRLADVLGDERLTYAAAAGLSMTENWNRAMEQARGRYVTYIGDDDGIGAGFYEAVRWAAERELPALVAAHPVPQYWWPDFPDPTLAGSCTCYRHDGSAIAVPVGPLVEDLPASFYGANCLPRVAGGVLDRRLMDAIRTETGEYFRSATPDHYSMYRISMLVDVVQVVDYPLVIAGACGRSNTAASTTIARREAAWDRHLDEHADLEWPSLLPARRTRSVGVLIAEGFVTAARDAGREDLVERLNLAGLYLVALRSDPRRGRQNLARYRAALRELDRDALSEIRGAGRAIAEHGSRALRRRHHRVSSADHLHPAGPARRLRGLETVAEAIDAVEDEFSRLGVRAPWD